MATQGGVAIACLVLATICRALWARVTHLEDERARLLSQGILDARKDAADNLAVQRQIVEEQTRTREGQERLARLLEGGKP